jgi:ElaB/YqjD/DUF883 family membrane-anchored ribosome-binding protein
MKYPISPVKRFFPARDRKEPESYFVERFEQLLKERRKNLKDKKEPFVERFEQLLKERRKNLKDKKEP